jgi:hypothetical protein
LLNAANVFPNRPGFDVCPGFQIKTPNPPDFAIGCVAVFDPLGAITPGSKQWRAFPEAANHADGWWYTGPDQNTPDWIDWKGARWIIQKGALSLARPITQAFPESMAVLTDPATFGVNALSTWGVLPWNPSADQLGAFADFQRAFAQAWKSNKEFWLNGRHGADDVQVLEHFARIWNRGHMPGQGLDVGAAPANTEVNLAGGGLLVYSPYFTTLVTQLGRANVADVMSSDGMRVHINTGPMKQLAKPLNFSGIIARVAAAPKKFLHSGATDAYKAALAKAQAEASSPHPSPPTFMSKAITVAKEGAPYAGGVGLGV